ncbi:MAG: diacylglycerol/polyprenol kinase family protein [Candidatus Hydrothermarchaeales archaeon]
MNRLERKRQLIHASGVFIALLLLEIYQISGGWLVPAALLAIGIAGGYAVSNLYLRGVNMPFLTGLIAGSERARDQEFPGRGALRFFTGALLTLLVFRNTPSIFTAGIVVLALGDSASTLGGVAYGRHKLPYNRDKSIEGSVSGFAAAFAGLILLTPLPAVAALAAAAVGMATESLPIGFDDNLTVPLAAAFTAWILTRAITI